MACRVGRELRLQKSSGFWARALDSIGTHRNWETSKCVFLQTRGCNSLNFSEAGFQGHGVINNSGLGCVSSCAFIPRSSKRA